VAYVGDYALQWRGHIYQPTERAMKEKTEKRPLLTDTLPAFAHELQRLLAEAGEPKLAAQVPTLRVFGRCSCGDDFCSTFYTQPKPEGAYGPHHRNVVLAPDEGTVILDIVGEQVCCVEVLDRPEIREKLLAALA
jgi:hypothetical protein